MQLHRASPSAVATNLSHDVTERFHGERWFEARVVILDADGEENSVAILDTDTLVFWLSGVRSP